MSSIVKIVIGITGLVVAVVSGFIFYTFFFPKNTPVAPIGAMPKEITATSQAFSNFSSDHSLTPLATNQWYSSVLFDFPTQPIFAFPIAYKLSSKGISFSYPDIKKTDNTIFAPFTEDFTIGLDSDFTKPKIQAIGDFSIGLGMTSKDNHSLSFTIGHGIPFTVLHIDDAKTIISLPNDFQLYDDNADKALASPSSQLQTFVLTTRNHNYIISLDKKSLVTVSKTTLTIPNAERMYVGLLPTRKNYTDFKNTVDAEITDTLVNADVSSDSVSTKYELSASGRTPLIALYPHQYDTLSDDQSVLGTYQTLRGPLNLISANSFTTKIPMVVPPDSFSKIKNPSPELISQIKTDIASVISTKQPDSQDYYLGTWLGKVDNLLLLADTFGLKKERQDLVTFVEPIYISSLQNFSYDKKMTSIIPKKPEFGAELNNDHHFHYGYYIRTGAVLAKFDPAIVAKIKPQLSLMVLDIANTDRNNDQFPFLRHFDMYEGHSWADGKAGFGDGNNQESSSEAINAWYGVYLWSKTIHDDNTTQYALYGYNTEMQSTDYYWFDIKNMYGDGYAHAIGSIIWGGKVDFSTWFSAETNMKYGIQLLPFTPASEYLGKLPNFSKYQKDFAKSNGDITKDWGDMFVMWESFYAPKDAFAAKDKVQKLEGDNTRSMLLYEIYKNQ